MELSHSRSQQSPLVIQAQLQDDGQSDAFGARDEAFGVLDGDDVEGRDGALGGDDAAQEFAALMTGMAPS